MTYLFVFVGLALAASIAGTALSGHYRRYDRVTQVDGASQGTSAVGQVRRGTVKLIATPEEVTRRHLAASQAYDAGDDLLDPRNPHHAQWFTAQTDVEPPRE